MTKRAAPAEPDLLASEAARCMFPGLVTLPVPAPVEAAELAEAGALPMELELYFVNLVKQLQRVNTDPGSGDLAFVQGVRGVAPQSLSDQQVRRLRALAWKYRAQLSKGLRPATRPADDGLVT